MRPVMRFVGLRQSIKNDYLLNMTAMGAQSMF